MPGEYRINYEIKQHPKVLLTDKDFNMFIILGDKKDWPLEQVQKSNIARLWYIYNYGGIYSDLDIETNYRCLLNHLPHEGFWHRKNYFLYASSPKNEVA